MSILSYEQALYQQGFYQQIFCEHAFYEQAFHSKIFYKKLVTEEIHRCVHEILKCRNMLELYDHYKKKTAALVSSIHLDLGIETNDHRLEGIFAWFRRSCVRTSASIFRFFCSMLVSLNVTSCNQNHVQALLLHSFSVRRHIVSSRHVIPRLIFFNLIYDIVWRSNLAFIYRLLSSNFRVFIARFSRRSSNKERSRTHSQDDLWHLEYLENISKKKRRRLTRGYERSEESEGL